MPSLDAFKSGCLFVVVEKQGLELLHIGRGVGTAIQDTTTKQNISEKYLIVVCQVSIAPCHTVTYSRYQKVEMLSNE